MACEGAKAAREGLIVDMVRLREVVSRDAMMRRAQASNVVINESDKVSVFFTGYLSAAIDLLAAAVIALAGPCCEDCDE